MLQHPLKLQTLIQEYERLRNLKGFTPQSRGQRLNHFIVEVLQCWGIRAVASIRSKGEIDVAFELSGRRFIVEAKWENAPIDTGAIAKLQKRLRQRLGGTIGLFLSMSGFSPEALEELTDGEQLMVLLLSRDHFEAIVSGFIPPHELIDILLTRASFYGDGYISLLELFSEVDVNDLEINFNNLNSLSNNDLIFKSAPNFQAHIVASNIPINQSGIMEYSKNEILLTLRQGVYKLDLQKKKIDVFLAVPECIGNTVITNDKTVYVLRGYGIASVKSSGEFRIVCGGLYGTFGGQSRLFLGEDDDVYVISNGQASLMTNMKTISTMITKIGRHLGDEQRYTTDLEPGQDIRAAFVDQKSFFVVGSVVRGYAGGFALIDLDNLSNSIWLGIGSKYAKSVIRLADKNFVAVSQGVLELSTIDPEINAITSIYGVELLIGDPSTYMPPTIAYLNLPGDSVELTGSAYGGGYMLSNYPRSNDGFETKGVLVRWQH